jgi:hypothetical protein
MILAVNAILLLSTQKRTTFWVGPKRVKGGIEKSTITKFVYSLHLGLFDSIERKWKKRKLRKSLYELGLNIV